MVNFDNNFPKFFPVIDVLYRVKRTGHIEENMDDDEQQDEEDGKKEHLRYKRNVCLKKEEICEVFA